MKKISREIPIAISVKNISKKFIIPHEKNSTLRGTFTNLFNKKDHDVLTALNNISFDIKKGEFFGIVGRNGSGKSTLLKILAGIYTSDTGEIVTNGAVSSFLQLGLGFNAELSGKDNIYLNAAVLGMKEKEINEKYNDIVAFSELERFIDQKIKNYSSGMYMRLAFSIAIHANHDILLMDEVLAVGDSLFAQKCILELQKLRKTGKTIVLVSHGEEIMRDFANRVMILDQGEIKIIGPVERAIYTYNSILTNNDKKQNELPTKIKSKKENRIISVCIENDHDIGSSVFEYGDTINFVIEYSVNNISKQLHIGFGIMEKITGIRVCGNNTYLEKINMPWKKGKNIVKISFPNNILNKGDFTFVTGLFVMDEGKQRISQDVLDGKEQKLYFRVISQNKNIGIVEMQHKWIINN